MKQETKLPQVGKIEYFAPSGTSYTQVFFDEESYIRAIADELGYNPYGFIATTISVDSRLRKRVRELYRRIWE